MSTLAATKRFSRIVALFFESGLATVTLTALLFSIDPNTLVGDMTKGGDRVAWLIPPVVVLAFWLALREKRLPIKRFSLIFHSLYVALVLAGLVVYWLEPFPD